MAAAERVDITAVCNIQASGAVAIPGQTVEVLRAEAEALVASGAAVWPSRPARDGDPEDALALDRVHGIGPVTAGKLRAAGVADLRDLVAAEADGVLEDEMKALGFADDLPKWAAAARQLVAKVESQG